VSSQPRATRQLLTTSRRRAFQLFGVGAGALFLAARGAAATPVSAPPATSAPHEMYTFLTAWLA
jgi:hypothetical protein